MSSTGAQIDEQDRQWRHQDLVRGGAKETKKKQFESDTQKYYEIRAINSNKATGLYIFTA